MDIQEQAKRFIEGLPEDLEGPERSLYFRELIGASNSSTLAWHTAKAVYRLAGSGEWQVREIADLSMLVYSLLDNVELIDEVRPEVEFLLRGCAATGLWSGWDYVCKFAPTTLAA
jgi:hypothetical protein